MTIKAFLKGDPIDLEAIAYVFSEGDPCVSGDHEGFYVTSAAFDGLTSGPDFHAAASSLLLRINGVARALDGNFRPVRLVGSFADESGLTHVVATPDTAEGRAYAMPPTVQGEAEPPRLAPRGPAYFDLAESQPDVADAQAILGKPLASLGWVDLYKLYEIVRHNVGGEQALENKRWVDKKDLSSFRISANHQSLSGEDARHARMNTAPPSYSIGLDEGRALISRIMVAWWDELDPSP
ncbi:hypothetical protein KMT30_12520 [Streptomyces sp. IBSBF 2953]|nr:hypothetical protein [Streptomyces hayashii]